MHEIVWEKIFMTVFRRFQAKPSLPNQTRPIFGLDSNFIHKRRGIAKKITLKTLLTEISGYRKQVLPYRSFQYLQDFPHKTFLQATVHHK